MKSLSMFAAAALGLALPGVAHAAVNVTSHGWAPGALTANIRYTPTNLSMNVGVGRFKLNGIDTTTNQAVSFLTWCVDIFHTLQPAVFNLADAAVLVPDAGKRTQLATLIAQTDPLLALSSNKAETAAAIQLAVWEITNEQSASYSFDTGTFRSSGGNSDNARALAATYLGKVTSGAWAAPTGQLKLLYAPNSQSQLISAVPEPASWAMMLSGFALVGGFARRRTPRNMVTA